MLRKGFLISQLIIKLPLIILGNFLSTWNCFALTDNKTHALWSYVSHMKYQFEKWCQWLFQTSRVEMYVQNLVHNSEVIKVTSSWKKHKNKFNLRVWLLEVGSSLRKILCGFSAMWFSLGVLFNLTCKKF